MKALLEIFLKHLIFGPILTKLLTDGRTYVRTNTIAMDPSGTRRSKNQKNLMKRSREIGEKPNFLSKFDILTWFPWKQEFLVTQHMHCGRPLISV